MSDLITYDDKIRLKSQNVSEKYKVTAGDMNEIKSVVNTNAEEVDEINKPENWVSVGTTAPTDGERVWFNTTSGEEGIYVDNEQWYIKPKILWSGRATSVSVNLTGYSLIEVIFCNNDNFYNSLKVPVSGSTFSRTLALCNNYMPNTMESSSNVYLKYGQAILTQAGITINSNVEIPFSNTAGQIRWQSATKTLLYITTIIGYK